MDMPFIICCDRCGKVAPIDTEKSTDTWIVYKTDSPCSCGGKYVMNMRTTEEE